ncbi:MULTISPECIES: acyltransferase family protein [Enterococcus]|uniref:Acyltransferase 3 domain-containing protein n=1 Tax=Enterococcus dispar ATCC 51266 TaxID=1139219 RepID=S0KKA4_9ENTE|nr:acyltransferase family protein [Enterococcus dispar]EOT41385.1 hypothetical protein OMK_01556 [Enterococcus dispar ATCC 51266]EOW86981.1 hypothetical protein I569_02350 [Enterococcus dispar ATCC 51266]MCU7356773.1 acyltransferase family protein [Enterococcus dispar]MDT2706710.1 acyltransferase family protein [Enterococcus dispar]
MKQRLAFFDNAKFILMILVVFTHLLEPFIEDWQGYHNLYYFIFIFHMPAFVLIAGYFSKGLQKSNAGKILKKTLFPYLIFQLVYSCYYTLIGLEDSFSWNLLLPNWSLWFLISLFCWQCSLTLFKKISPPLAIAVSILLALVVGYLPFIDRNLAMQRSFVFLPFFLIGHYFSWEKLVAIRQSHRYSFALVGFGSIFAFINQFETFNKYLVFGSKPYADFLSDPQLGAFIRLLVMLLGFVGILSFLLIVPRQKTIYSDLGRNTLTVYLLQGFVIKGLRALNIAEFNLGIGGFISLLIFSVGLTFWLASPKWQQFMRTCRKSCKKVFGNSSKFCEIRKIPFFINFPL